MMTRRGQVVFATSNPKKVEEVRAILEPAGFDVVGLDHFPPDTLPPEPEEDADTFAGNARIKAIAYARAIGIACLADDSGLVVDALDGAPGVYSARYAGIGESRAERDEANNNKLLRELGATPLPQRTARFVCAMAWAEADGTIRAESEGTFEGVIGNERRGTNGFGYDPLLILDDGRTSAELPASEKNARSHRGAATRAIIDRIFPAAESSEI